MAKLSRATYYYHHKKLTAPDKYAQVKNEIKVIFTENKQRVGYRRVTDELKNRGFTINHKTVQRLMKQLGLLCRVRMRKYKSYHGEVGKIAPDLLKRNFEADKPNQKWVTDITEFSLFGQKLYLSPILDLHSRDIVSYAISKHPRFSLVTDMLEQAFQKETDTSNIIFHSDQGWQVRQEVA